MTLVRRPPPLGISATPVPDPPAALRIAGQRLRLTWRVAAILLVTLPASLIQAVLVRLPGSAKRRFARTYWATICYVMGIDRKVVTLHDARPTPDRPVVYIANHTSWLDIVTLGGTLPGCFVAKAEVASWPIISLIARLGSTVFVSRRVSGTSRERDNMRARLDAGDDLILFPEGTSSDGARTLPFRSPFFSVAEPQPGAVQPLIQPVSIVFDRVDFLPVGRSARPVTSWYGGMDLGAHFFRLARYRRLRATILLHPPVDPADFDSRKTLSRAVWQVVADGAAALRQNRPPPADRPSIDAMPDSLDRATASIARVQRVSGSSA